MQQYASVAELLREENPREPVYCIFPHVYRASTREFLEGFPGRVLYAVKANNHPTVLQTLIESGVRHFDCASLPEIALLDTLCPDGTKYFMVPTRIRDAAQLAQAKYGVRHFMVDHLNGIAQLAKEIDMSKSVVFARMAVHHDAAMVDLSHRFGAQPEQMPALLEAIGERGAEPALAFNVGSSVTHPEAYRHALRVAQSVLQQLPFRVRLLDVGGGYPKSYPGFSVPNLQDYFAALENGIADVPLAENAEILGEPGRALSAPGMSAVVEVILRKGDQLFINDGMFGIFWELRYHGHEGFPVRAWRNLAVHDGATRLFRLHGPTCDSSDTLPGLVELPEDIAAGDHLEFGSIGAYSLSGRTDFNGYYSNNIVIITGDDEQPPALSGSA